MIITYYQNSKSTHNLKDMKLIFLKTQKKILNFKFSRIFYHIQNKVIVYDIRDKNLKQLAYFDMIQNYDKFSK